MIELIGLSLFDIGAFTFTMAHAFVIAGAALVISEAFIPGANAIVFGTGLLGSGLIGMATGLGMNANESDVFVLSLMAFCIGVVAFYIYQLFLRHPDGESYTTTSSEDLKGETGTVLETVTEDSGRVRVRGVGSNPEYQARCRKGKIEPGTRIKVVDPGGGSLLRVEPIPDGDPES